MNIEDKLDSLIKYREKRRIAAGENYKFQSKRRLQKTIETKINTTMIGAISAVEQKFGFLWGQGKPASELTERELDMLALKDELRTEILNLGNNQKRAAVAEINQYEIEWKRHHMELAVQQRALSDDDYRKLCTDVQQSGYDLHPKTQDYLDKINKKDGRDNV